jgi:hypothetical protein
LVGVGVAVGLTVGVGATVGVAAEVGVGVGLVLGVAPDAGADPLGPAETDGETDASADAMAIEALGTVLADGPGDAPGWPMVANASPTSRTITTIAPTVAAGVFGLMKPVRPSRVRPTRRPRTRRCVR